MTQQSKQNLSEEIIRKVFIEQITILYNSKTSLITNLPKLIDQATFKNLKSALQEELEDSKKQLEKLKEIFKMMSASSDTEKNLSVDTIIAEALDQVTFNEDNHYSSDMSILFYMSAIENMHVGACRILNILVKKIPYKPYKQLIKECLDISADNRKLIQYVAEEYYDVK